MAIMTVADSMSYMFSLSRRLTWGFNPSRVYVSTLSKEEPPRLLWDQKMSIVRLLFLFSSPLESIRSSKTWNEGTYLTPLPVSLRSLLITYGWFPVLHRCHPSLATEYPKETNKVKRNKKKKEITDWVARNGSLDNSCPVVTEKGNSFFFCWSNFIKNRMEIIW